VKKSWPPIKEMLFTYLAVTKILYWLNAISAIEQSGLSGVGDAVLTRLLHQDAIIIAGVVFFHFLENSLPKKMSKYNKVLEQIVFYAIGFVALIGIVLIYNLIVFGPIQIESWGAFIGGSALGYLVIMAVLNLKIYFKAKIKPEYGPPAQHADDKLSMLKTLLDDGVLTQEEFDRMK